MKNNKLSFKENAQRTLLVILAIGGLAAVFIFQEADVVSFFDFSLSPNVHFVVKKIWRVLLNDLLMLLFIYAWFYHRPITLLAWKLQLIDTFILLPIYLVLKLSLEGTSELSSPLLSQLHRLIVNPTIMVLLIPAVYFQRMQRGRES